MVTRTHTFKHNNSHVVFACIFILCYSPLMTLLLAAARGQAGASGPAASLSRALYREFLVTVTHPADERPHTDLQHHAAVFAFVCACSCGPT